MKRLISLISSHGKSPQQSTQEVGHAYLKFKKVEAQVTLEASLPKPQEKPSTTPPAKTPRLSTEEFWKNHDTTKEHLGGAIQITNYPHSRKPKPSLSVDELIEQHNQKLQKEGKFDPNLAPKEGEMLAHLFRKTPKYPKNKLQKDINT